LALRSLLPIGYWVGADVLVRISLHLPRAGQVNFRTGDHTGKYELAVTGRTRGANPQASSGFLVVMVPQ
jgi:hypothetical protein